ncbi:hypothetical protein RRG08_067166 [Elysia crispata]|uniref:Uncharacterized protein n=1 Tax=Elysia crispata TaxID=231223 RepID=A0AAE1D9P0_9GAST|nr:hypothetical protein RRG08_067166 [Elysia crispata]
MYGLLKRVWRILCGKIFVVYDGVGGRGKTGNLHQYSWCFVKLKIFRSFTRKKFSIRGPLVYRVSARSSSSEAGHTAPYKKLRDLSGLVRYTKRLALSTSKCSSCAEVWTAFSPPLVGHGREIGGISGVSWRERACFASTEKATVQSFHKELLTKTASPNVRSLLFSHTEVV